jgi:DNA repair exonuclease SbcCD ATPase subunit
VKISSLKLRNFRSHRDTSLELARINIVRGRNGAGKSSIQMALEQLFTGKCDVTDQAGRGAQALISSGAGELFIEAVLAQPPHTLLPMNYKRSVTSGQLIIGPHTGQSATQWLEANIAPIPVLSSVLNAHRFLEMNAKEQKALLAGALAPTPVPIDAEIRTLHAEIAAGFPMQECAMSAEHVDSLYDWHFKQRTNINREIKALGELKAPEEPQEKHSLSEVRAMITEIQKERDQKVKEREKLLAEFRTRETRLQAAKAQKAMHEPDLLSSDELERLSKIAKNRSKAEKLDQEIPALQSALRSQRNELVALKEPQSDKCPACGQSVAVENGSEMIAKLEALIPVSEKQLADKQAERTKLADPILAQDKIDRHQRSMKPYNAAEMAIKEIGELGQEPDTGAIDEEINALDNRITCGNQVADEVSKYEGAKAQYDRQLATLDKKRAIAEAFDRLVEYFGPNGGLKAKLIGGKLPAFRDRINEVLHRFGFECEFELEPYALSVVRLDGPGGAANALSLQQLSESEQYRFSIAFQIALAEATGVNLCVIDRADMLSPDARGELTAALMESSLDQAFVLCTGEPGPTPEIPDVRFFELVNDEGATALYVPEEEEAHANQ